MMSILSKLASTVGGVSKSLKEDGEKMQQKVEKQYRAKLSGATEQQLRRVYDQANDRGKSLIEDELSKRR